MNSPKKQLTLGQETYIETIDRFCREHGHAHTKMIADALSIRMPSVTEALNLLAQKGCIHYQARKTITLTEEGQKLALELRDRHDLLRDFYQDILGLSKSKANQIACKVEHVIDREFAEHLADFQRFLQEELSPSSADAVKKFKDRYQKIKNVNVKTDPTVSGRDMENGREDNMGSGAEET